MSFDESEHPRDPKGQFAFKPGKDGDAGGFLKSKGRVVESQSGNSTKIELFSENVVEIGGHKFTEEKPSFLRVKGTGDRREAVMILVDPSLRGTGASQAMIQRAIELGGPFYSSGVLSEHGLRFENAMVRRGLAKRTAKGVLYTMGL